MKRGDIVWSGQCGGSGDTPFHIILNDPGSKRGGCFCPREAIPFLTKLGVHILPTTHYKSGYAAAGCIFHSDYKEITPRIKKVYAEGIEGENDDFLFLLKKISRGDTYDT